MSMNVVLGMLLVAVASLPLGARAQDNMDNSPLVHQTVVDAPIEQVWAAFTTKAGLESWMVAHAEVDVKVGGALRTQYDPAGSTDDARAIVNTILSFEPLRMLSFRVTRAPQGFPFPNAIATMWTVIYFEPRGETATSVREVSLGFGGDEESQRMRAFFERGNAFTLKRLQEHFAAGLKAK